MQNIQWCPFSDKHIDYIHNALDCKMSVAEGAVRSGKTIDNCIIACAYLEECEDKIHLASGSTVANAKLNIGYCNGFGLECLFKGRCRWGKFMDNDALIIRTKTGEKVVIFVGGGKADSYKKILGNSYGLWIATEINEHYDSDNVKESFIKVAFDRQIASKQPKVLWDLNPCSPNHKIYKNYIDAYGNIDFVGGYNYEHFTIKDNLSINEETKRAIVNQYGGVNTVWYKRNILGMRCVAEGNIYEDFANNTDKYLLTEEELKKRNLSHLYVGVDFGGNGSANAFVCVGFTYGLKEIIVLEAERHGGKTNPAQLEERFALFLEKVYNKYGKGGNVFCDSAETTLIGGLKSKVSRENLHFNIDNAKKNEVNQRIKLVLRLMALNKFKVCEWCDTVIKALSEAVYNSKEGHEDERLDNGTSDVDSLDALEYAIEPHINDLKYLT